MSTVNRSVVIPIFNSAATLPDLVARLQNVLSGMGGTYELILVDDASTDGSWELMKALRNNNPCIRIVRLVRNFGQHNATFCGLTLAKGECVVIMDDDLQHPPEEIPKLISTIGLGYGAVYGKYSIKCHSWFENLMSRQFQWLMHYILDIPAKTYISSFAAFRDDVVRNITTVHTPYVFLPALVRYCIPASSIGNVEVEHCPRQHGISNYTIGRHLVLLLNLSVNYSALPLTAIGVTGIIASVFSFIAGVYIIVKRILDPSYGIMGWNSLMITLTLIGGLILFSLGIIGEYLRRIITEISYGRPYMIAEMEG